VPLCIFHLSSQPEQQQQPEQQSEQMQAQLRSPETPEQERLNFGILSWLLGLLDRLYCFPAIAKKYLLPFLRHWTYGWGDMEAVKKLPDVFCEAWKKHEQGPEFWGSQVQFPIENVDSKIASSANQVLHGTFQSPLHAFMPPACAQVPFEVVLPAGEPWAVVVLCAGTADDTYIYRRKAWAEPLLKHGVACILPTNCFYGPRQRKGQKLFFLNTFVDLVIQFHAGVTEGLVLLDWARLRFPKALLGISGMSFGGGTAWICAKLAQHDLAVVPMLAPASGAALASGALIHDLALECLADGGQMSHEEIVKTVIQLCEDRHSVCSFHVAWGRLASAGYKEKRKKCVTCVNAAHDGIVVPESSKKALEDMQRYMDPQTRCHWISGGHITCMVNPRRTVHFVLEGLQRLERESAQTWSLNGLKPQRNDLCKTGRRGWQHQHKRLMHRHN